ncbi:MAG TPA: ABC transporter ATP-binding protein [Actinomycetales bacterium]|nr:ABC transporter ATP-binding protein [Actinomycetales bacterium]
MTSGIGCRDLVVRAGGRTVLDVPSLEVVAGTTLAVLGRNGAGKSTLLRALALLAAEREGTVLLDGTPATRQRVRTAVAAVLQRPVVRRGSVRHNVASGLLLRGHGRAKAHAAAAAWMDRLGIAHLAEQQARSLSGGERQRVALARALAVRPRVLLLDEPFAGLDATTRTDFVADLRAVLDDPGLATVLVTHDRDEAAALAGCTALLVDGRLRQVGPTSSVLDHPADADCARLVGFANVLSPELTGLRRTVVCRPEHAVVSAAAPTRKGALVVAGRLVRIVPLGGITRVDVTAGRDGDVALSGLVAGEVPAPLRAEEPGAAVSVSFAHQHLRDVPA